MTAGEERDRWGREWLLLATVTALALATTLAIATTMAWGAECRTERGDRHLYWSWRQIDGRRCWYAGPPGVSKAALHWARLHPREEERPRARRRQHPRPAPHPARVADPDVWPPPPRSDPDVWPPLKEERR